MTTQRCIEWFADKELQEFIRAECRRHSHREELGADFFSSAWVAISEHKQDDCDLEELKRIAHNAIFKAYRAELRERKLTKELARIYESEEADPRFSAPSGRRRDAGIVLLARDWDDRG
jgi:DNA-directed RNA polymerase specialized sigma24 family protein